MELGHASEAPTIEQTVESLAQTVAHLALQLTVAQMQLRALATVLEETGQVSATVVTATAADLATSQARTTLVANMGAQIADLVDLDDLERQIVEYLAVGADD
ncbi:MAG TPA: hypothetical protein PK691_05620 [Thermomicrobiales bacterium]|nr:hypothetical protein [Thermomicrobiales bacterium]HRA48979.1 hypothetical protein [Thermomicrobiales bacterium]